MMRSSRWFASAVVVAVLAACGGGGGGSAGETKSFIYDIAPPTASPQDDADASRFLAQATFGPTLDEINRLKSAGFDAWMLDQMNRGYASHVQMLDRRVMLDPEKEQPERDWVQDSFWREAIDARAQLRHRVAFALSQIFVISMNDGDVSRYPLGVASYLDMLNRNAFGNYRTLLEEVTLHPMMGIYLTHIGNQKEDPATNRTADENYAREVLQLFSIGVVELAIDGTPVLDPQGVPVETYTNDDVTGLAKVFTGLSWGGGDTSRGRFMGWESANRKEILPMQGYPQYHSMAEKRFLGATLPAGSDDVLYEVRAALDVIAGHPNVGPFIGKQLIQRLVTSNPSPAYIARVATVFNDNGHGERGDLAAVVRAILYDPEARDQAVALQPGWGKIREPILRLTNWARASRAQSKSDMYKIGRTTDPASSLGQAIFYSPSVFNFYRPGYVAPNTPAGMAGLLSPEMQITDESSVAGYLNTMRSVVKNGAGSGSPRDVQMDYYREWVPLAADPAELVQRVNLLLLHGQMSNDMRIRLIEAVDSVNLNRSNAQQVEEARLNRVRLALFLTLASAEYLTQK
ncbi:MAG: DUF1800 domain-containing protein [Pseudomonadota bacterium]|nr:DUF1800 domain-containing protein [Pseudomonadota bacterium]